MNNEIVTYAVQLDHPDFYVEFKAEAGLTEDEILTFAIEEMTRNTEVYNVKIKKKGWLLVGVMVKYFQLMGPEGIRLATYHRVEGKNETDSKIPCETSGVTMEYSPKVVPQFYNLLVIDGIVWVDGYGTNLNRVVIDQ